MDECKPLPHGTCTIPTERDLPSADADTRPPAKVRQCRLTLSNPR